MARKRDKQPPKTKKYFRSTKSGAGMTKAGVARYRRDNPGSKLKTAVTGKVKKGSAAAKRRKSFCARSAGQMKKFPKAAKESQQPFATSKAEVEMLNFNTLISGATLAFIGWIAFSVVELKTETAVISVKVDQNHKLLAELWDFYLQERVNADIAWANRKPNLKASDER